MSDVPQWLEDLMDLLGLDDQERADWVRRFNAGTLHHERSPLFLYQRTSDFIGERELLQAKAQERGVGFVDLGRLHPEPGAIQIASRHLVTETGAVPVQRDGSTVWVAMRNDRDVAAIDRYRLETGCRVIPVLAIRSALAEWIERYYPAGG